MARFYVDNEQTPIPIAAGGVPLPNGSAFMLPGIYQVLGFSYDCTRPGLYVWFNKSAMEFVNRIVWEGVNGSVDVYATVSAICWNHVHGTGTEYGFDGASLQVMSNAGRYFKWSARCGYMAYFAVWLFNQLGVNARVISVSTIGPKNGKDDGHVVFETLHYGEWRMWDITSGCYFCDDTGKHLSVSGIIDRLTAGLPMPCRIAIDDDSKYNYDYAGSLDMGRYWSWNLETPEQFDAWYRRIFQSIV